MDSGTPAFERQGHKDTSSFSDKMRALNIYCNEAKKKLVFGCDANVHHCLD